MQKEEMTKVDMGGVSETLLLTVYFRAKESAREDGIIDDKFAEDWVSQMEYNFEKFDKDRLSVVGVSIRTEVLDEIVSRFVKENPNGIIVNIGAGLCTRFQRIDNGSVTWFELDVPEALDLRKKFVSPFPPRYRYIEKSAFDYTWLDDVAVVAGENDGKVLIVAEGVLMYFEESEVKELFRQIRTRFPKAEVVTDTMPKFSTKMSIKHHKSVSQTDARFKWGLGKTSELCSWNLGIEIIKEYSLFNRHTRRLGLISLLRFIPLGKRLARLIHFRFDDSKTSVQQDKIKRGLWAIMGPVMPYIYIAIFTAAFGATFAIVSIYFMAEALNALITGKSAAVFGQALDLKYLLILVVFLVILSFLCRSGGFIISHLGAFRLEQIIRTRLSGHLAKVPLGFITNTGSGTLKKILVEDVNMLHAFVADSTPFIGKSLAGPVVSLIMMFVIDWRLALVSMAVLLLGGAFMRLSMKDSETLRKKYDEGQEKINSAVIEFVQAMPVVRTFDVGTSSFRRYTKALDEFRIAVKSWYDYSGKASRAGLLILSPMPTLLAVSATGIYFVSAGSLSFPHFIALIMISTGMADSLMPLMWLNNFIKKSEAGAYRIQDIMAVNTMPVTKKTEHPKEASIVFDNVSFMYENRESYALEDVSFKVPEGSVTALVGPSGAGKSTVAKLIPRFWDVEKGSIRIGGTDVRDMLPETLMSHVSFVFQDTFLFNDTIANNIRLAKPDALDKEVYEAAKASQIHDFISSLPDGYRTLVGDRGIRLSGGQKQRITIARAILRNAPIVVLDEATAFADPENEEEIIKAVSSLMKGKTVIIIAHRLSTIKNVNQIIVFDKGRIAEKGSHEELIKNNGLYSVLWDNYEEAQSWNLKKTRGK